MFQRMRTHNLLPAVYDELRVLARRYLANERVGHTLQPTALVHEVYLRLSAQDKDTWESRRQFFIAAAITIRRILVNHERDRRALRRGGGRSREPLCEDDLVTGPVEVDLLAVNELLDQLAELDERQARIIELRFFVGLTTDEIAAVLGISPRSIRSEWALARAWLGAGLARGAAS
jgi:RNA polymerase sigma-70 factor (ECF subfamily)